MGEELLFHWADVYGIKVLSLRIFNTYGPRVRTTVHMVLYSEFLKQKLENQTFTLVEMVLKKGTLFMLLMLLKLFTKAISNLSNITFNLGSGKPKSILWLIKLLGGNYVKIPKRPGEPNITHANINKIRKILKWSPKINFDQGVKNMLNNITDWKNAPLWNEKKIDKATRVWFKYLSKKWIKNLKFIPQKLWMQISLKI